MGPVEYMKFQTKQIKGKGRGKLLGFPTINMEIPPDLVLEEGVYAVKVIIEKKTFMGALHYGPVPTFGENNRSLEVFLLDSNHVETLNTSIVQITPIAFIREVRAFSSKDELIAQMHQDIAAIRRIGFPGSAG